MHGRGIYVSPSKRPRVNNRLLMIRNIKRNRDLIVNYLDKVIKNEEEFTYQELQQVQKEIKLLRPELLNFK